ncbi:hypothetical protein CVIRNUC_004838 [Coccomyxa viridis]|uniref:Uncharacterized protein n=1 Tax=Coccomyxa viridis TaxID=1274662 RepID=A0AAV1I589_9CHLO|nr:hypothetical protein CVIRNUC_004838 [Coccomyxa viridis]
MRNFDFTQMLCLTRMRRTAGYGVVPNVSHLPVPHPDWSPESGEKQRIPYDDQPFLELDPEVMRHRLYPSSSQPLSQGLSHLSQALAKRHRIGQWWLFN